MTKEDWLHKLTSRKFWSAIAGFVTGLIAFLKNPTGDAATITALIMSFGSLIAFIVAEGLVDAAREKANTYNMEPKEKPPENE